ncbi:DUF805 domain-containing protein [Dialister succinatiphilus]|uniref:DUF805 domain-containing protein n=1 Tax=Dialister succinatiphilus TaxID=487173 RepID=UPI004029C04E
MNMDFDIPDISENAGKAAGGGKHRKPRRAGKIRLGDSLRSISREYTATRERMDEDKHIEFYSLSEGQEHFPFYGMEVSIIGVCIRNKKTAAIYMELPLDKREDLIQKLSASEGEGEGEDTPAMTIFSDTVTSIFVTKPEKGEKVVTIALMDSEEAKVLSDNEAIEEKQAEEAKGLGHKIFKTYFNPVGRISRRSYIPKILGAGIPAAVLFSFTCLKPELFEGDLNLYIFTFLVVGTLCFISLISLAMRRLSDIGLSHLYYWVFFLLLFGINQLGGQFLGSQLMATRVVAVVFMAAVVLLAFFPGENKKNKYGPVPKE